MNKTNLLSEGDRWLVKSRVHTHAHTVSTYSRHTVTNEHYCKHVDSHACTTTLVHISSISILHTLHLSVSVTTSGLYSGIPYTAVTKKCSLEKLYPKRKHNHSSFCSLVAPSLFLFYLLFVSPHFFPSQVFSGALQMECYSGKPYPIV